MTTRPVFSPSLMCMDLTRVGEQLSQLGQNATMMHIDIMDGHFVKNFSLSPAFVEQIRPHTSALLDAHVMVYEPSQVVDDLIAAGADIVSFHAETVSGEAFRLIDRLKSAGRRAGVVLNPETPVSAIAAYASRLYKVTVMTVAPGFAGEKFIPEMLEKITQLRELRERIGADFLIEADGQCNRKHFGVLSAAQPDALVVGTSGLFTLREDLADAWEAMLQNYDDSVREYAAATESIEENV